nr:ribonuclease H-like domain-containing protein [Tanacetum cinerariifolium]
MSYLSDFEELNGGYVAFGGNPKGGKISGKGKIRTRKLDFDDVYFVKELKFNIFSLSHICDKKNSVLFTDTECLVLSLEFKLPDENQVLLRVPRENNMYNVDLKNIVPSRDLTCLFSKATLDEKVDEGFLVGYSVSSKAFRVFNKKAREDNVQHYVLFPVWSSGFNNPQDTDGDDAFKEKEPVFEVRKSQSEVYVSSSSSAQRKKHDDKNKRDAKDKIPDDTNTFSAVGPSNTVVSPTQEKSSNVVTSQLPDDLNMLELEDITYSDDEEDVGAEADFTNLETTIIVSPIPTTRVHKDHPVTQIIGDLSLAT